MAELEETVVAEETAETTGATDEVAKLRAELAKNKAALDKATKEAGDYKKQLRAKQSAEEAAEEAEKERREAVEKELAELRKERAVANISKKTFTFLQDEGLATAVAEALFGAEDPDAAVDAFAKAWIAKEKKLRLEFGKIPAPGAGGSEGPSITKEELDKLNYRQRIEFATKHPDEYERLMGRKT